MSHRFSFQQEGQLLVIVFEGEISPEEERQALVDVATSSEFNPDARVLVDRRRARMTVGPSDVGPQIDLAEAHYRTRNKPKLALVVSSDYDYGMCRMLELTAAARDSPHQIRVWRNLEEACEWLDIALDRIEWP